MTESISKKPSQDFREGTSVTHWGVVKTTVVDGKISKIEPIPEDRRPSPNLKALAELLMPLLGFVIRWCAKVILKKGLPLGIAAAKINGYGFPGRRPLI